MSNTPLDRRMFARSLAAGAAVPLAAMASDTARAADEKAVKEPPKEKQEPKKEPPESKPALSPADLVLEMIKQQYPNRLDEKSLAEIRLDIHRQQARSRVLSSFPLTNADEPAGVFSAYRAKK